MNAGHMEIRQDYADKLTEISKSGI